jgi:hypothetical protein
VITYSGLIFAAVLGLSPTAEGFDAKLLDDTLERELGRRMGDASGTDRRRRRKPARRGAAQGDARGDGDARGRRVLSVDVVAVEIAPPGEMTWLDPIPMILTCPSCGERHVDQGEFATKPHHTHACQHCGMVWRPALVATVGVQFLPGFKDETGRS